MEGPFPVWQGPVGVKEDGGGCTRGRGRVGRMIIHRAVCNMDKEGTHSDGQCGASCPSKFSFHVPIGDSLTNALQYALSKRINAVTEE